METKALTTTEQIVALREKTGAGMMNCKRAIEEAGGDFNKALENLRKKGLADAAKKSTRTTKEGMVAAYVSPDGKQGSIVEINCETDFVAKTEDFQKLVATLAQKAAEGAFKAPEDAKDLIAPIIGKLGENMSLRRFERFQLDGPGLLGHYVHPVGHKKGAFILIAAATEAAGKHEATLELAKELGLQAVGMSPRWLQRADVPAAEIEKEKEIYAAQVKAEGKPEASIPKIVEGKINKLFFQAFCLLDMVSMRDNKTPMTKLVADAAAKAGGALTVKRFVRFQLGE